MRSRALRTLVLAAALLLPAACSSSGPERYSSPQQDDPSMLERLSPVADAVGTFAVYLLYELLSMFGDSTIHYYPSS